MTERENSAAELLPVTQADRDAAANLIESYWQGSGPTHVQMRKLAASYRAGHEQGCWAQAFARHRIAHQPRPQGGLGREEMQQALSTAFQAGCCAVHDNYQENRDPDFSEAGSDYAADAILALFHQAGAGEIDYEVWQKDAFGDGDAMVARSTDLSDAQHYADVYAQDGPTWIVEVTRRPLILSATQAGAGEGWRDFVEAYKALPQDYFNDTLRTDLAGLGADDEAPYATGEHTAAWIMEPMISFLREAIALAVSLTPPATSEEAGDQSHPLPEHPGA